MAGQVLTSKSLKEIYPDGAILAQKQRWKQLLAVFKERHGHVAEFVSRSPGRVNIIGEHIDYSLYEVLPMAVTADLLLAVSVTTTAPGSRPKIRISNVTSSKFASREFDISPAGEVEIDASSHEWSNYFRSGLRGALALLRQKRNDFLPVSMNVLVDGTVPSGGGLSSSAAFVCASALAVMKANGEEVVDKKELVELAVVSERAVGVHSGG
ncbi:MAG: galactokinase [Thelocarpon impressellum]|nr:MAG: galactokinase [Thelocarpon impressellum]